MGRKLFPFDVYDGFSTRTSAKGWGKADNGTEWKTLSSVSLMPFSVSSATGIAEIEGVRSRGHTQPDVTYLNVAPTGSQGMLFAFNPGTWEGYTDWGPVLLRKDANHYVCLRIQAGFRTISLWRRTPADQSIQRVFSVKTNNRPVATDTSYNIVDLLSNQWYWCRFEFSKAEDELRFRVWPDKTVEPSGWNMTFKASEYVDWSLGGPGFMNFDTTTYTSKVRSLYYYRDVTNETYTNGAAVRQFADYPIHDPLDRAGVDGFGQTADDFLVWYGNSLDSPLLTKHAAIGQFGQDTANRRCALIDFTSGYDSNGGYWAFLGNTVNGSMEVTTTFAGGAEDGKSYVRIGLRGREGLNAGTVSGIGTAVEFRLRGASSTMKFVQRSSYASDTWSDVLVNSQPVSKTVGIVANTLYRVRLQLKKTGTGWTLNARFWKNSDTEPTGWTITASGSGDLPVTSGAPFINTALERSATVTNAHKLYFYDFRASQALTSGTPPSDDDTTLTFTETHTVERTATTATVTFFYKGDPANTATRTISYWSLDGTTRVDGQSIALDAANANRETKTLVATLTGLTPFTEYVVEATLYDSDARFVRKQISFITAYNGILVQPPFVTDVTTGSFLLTVPFDPVSSFDEAVTASTTCKVEVFLGSTPVGTIKVTPSRSVGPRHTGPQYYAEVTGLLYDAEYRWKVTISDPDGTDESRTPTYTKEGRVKLEGEKPDLYWLDDLTGQVAPSPIEIVAEATTAKVTIHYRWDVLNQINFDLRYRPIGSQNTSTWVKVGGRRDYKIRARQTDNKSWSTDLIGLVPGLTYLLEVTVLHPAGVKGYSESKVVLEQAFTTSTFDARLHRRPKHYAFKVYQPSRVTRGVWNYYTTWKDATQPEFAYHENGGVSDMSLKLPRPVQEMYNDEFAFGNRVDCWVIDHTSNGIGRNLLADGDMDLGAWTYSDRWFIDPRGGPDESAALRVVTGTGNTATQDYALSEYVELANSQFRDAQYDVVISIGNLFDDFEDEIIKKQVNYSAVSATVKAKVKQLYPTEADDSFKKELERELVAILDNKQGALHRANRAGNFSLLKGVELRSTVNNYHQAREIEANGQVIGTKVLFFDKIEYDAVPYVLQFAARVTKGQVTAQIEYYDINSPFGGIDPGDVVVSEESVSTRETSWEVLKLVFTPPLGTRRMRVRFTAQGETEAYIDKALLLPQEYLLYRGTIESVKGSVEPDGEMIEVEVLGLVAKLTDFYVPFAQWVDRQPKRDQPRLVDPYMFDDEDPPALLGDLSEQMIKPRESYVGERRQSAIVFPDINESNVIVRVYYDGDANQNATCKLFYTRNLEAEFPPTDQKVTTAFAKGDFVWVGRNRLPLREQAGTEGEVILNLKRDDKLRVLDGPTYETGVGGGTVGIIAPTASFGDPGTMPAEARGNGGWAWYRVQTTDKKTNRTGWVQGELLRTGKERETSYLWRSITKERGRSHPDNNTGTLFDAYNWGWTAQRKDKDGNKQDNPHYEISARRDKKYFEFKVDVDGLNRRQNYKFVALFTDSDGVIDQTNLKRPDATAINTAARLLFPEIGTNSSPFTALTDLRTSEDQRTYDPPTDPSVMARKLIDLARLEDDYFPLYYDTESIKATGNIAQYTFRDTQLRNAMDKLRELCPPGWHWFVDPEGRFHLRGPQHTMTHRLRLGEQVLRYNIERTIKNLKNIVIVRGRQDEDASEPDGQGSISVTVRDELSIKAVGGRYLYLRDSNIKDQQTASTVAYGRLEENKRVEQQGSVLVVDEKEVGSVTTSLHGYNVEAIQPGDFIIIDDAGAVRDRVYWDQAIYNSAYWDAGDTAFFDNLIQIKSITYRGDHVEISLSQRPPSSVGDFAKLVRWQQMQESMGTD